MQTTVIDTLRFAQRLGKAGLTREQAEGMALALNEEVAESVVTKVMLQQELRPISAKLTQFEVRFDAIDQRLDAVDARLDGMGAKLGGMDARLDGMDTKLGGMGAKLDRMAGRLGGMEGRINGMEAKFDAKFDALDSKFKMLMAVMVFGFGLLGTLGLYNASSSPRQVGAAAAIAPGHVAKASPPCSQERPRGCVGGTGGPSLVARSVAVPHSLEVS